MPVVGVGRFSRAQVELTRQGVRNVTPNLALTLLSVTLTLILILTYP